MRNTEVLAFVMAVRNVRMMAPYVCMASLIRLVKYCLSFLVCHLRPELPTKNGNFKCNQFV